MTNFLASPFAKLLTTNDLRPVEELGTALAQLPEPEAHLQHTCTTPEVDEKSSEVTTVPVKQKLITCEYCTKISHKLVIHTEEEQTECIASRTEPVTTEAVPACQAELQVIQANTCAVCGSSWENHSESAREGCQKIIEASAKGLSEKELEIINQFHIAISRFSEIPEVNYLLVRQYFTIENKKLNDEQLRQKIANFQKSYIIGRIGESILTQEGNKKNLVLSEDGNKSLSLSAPTIKAPKEVKVKLSPKEKQIIAWLKLGMTKESAENLWNDTFGKAV